MQTVNIHEAKTNLSRLLDGVVHGEPFIIAKAGKPIVHVIPYQKKEASAKRIGFMPSAHIPDDFDTLGAEEIATMFAGKEE
ncbi:type II toxin-antitoxin system prevent-host-death family antitoxin [Neisseria chenwenguii]|uniref:Antitoxin n=2 Tax=Neisseria chenwenguii TaxID=1853278 RepID=A0A220S4J5_9NEIS|nr:type II toxin-antitoxin system prevent-host-death family antitoxin [Neisseria chenwenguii]ROV56158.1 type II toxin-antitoxin system Phd/YefM family antitoxin [Neisseria chenwenguii]